MHLGRHTFATTVTLSNGVPISISVSLDGKDAYTQTIVDTAQKVTTIEYYKRIK